MTNFVGHVQIVVVEVGDSSMTGASEEEDDIEGETGIASSILSNSDGVGCMVLLVQPIMTQRIGTNNSSRNR